MSGQSEKNTEAKTTKQGTSGLEWGVAAIAGVLFVVMVGYMVVEGFATAENRVEIQIIASPAVRQGNAFAVRFDARNIGNQTASSLVVRATLSEGDREVETAEVTIDYLPGRSSAFGGFWFSNDPSRLKVDIRAVSYLDP
jgi:uncharacterized protein (TIGR02588 family)